MGGTRPGAGRPPILKHPRSFTMVLEESTLDELAKLADDERLALTPYIRKVLEAHVARRRGRR